MGGDQGDCPVHEEGKGGGGVNYRGVSERMADVIFGEVILVGQSAVDAGGEYCFGSAVGRMQGTMNMMQELIAEGQGVERRLCLFAEKEVYNEQRT